MFQCQGFQFTSVHSSRVTDPYIDFGFKLVWLDLIDIFPFFPPCLGFCPAQTRVDVFEKMLMNQKKSLYKLSRIGYLLTPVEVGSLVREPK